jgi:hypothetical protein
MLLSGRCEVFGLEESGDLGFVVRDAEDRLISVMGRPAKVRSRRPLPVSGTTASSSRVIRVV